MSFGNWLWGIRWELHDYITLLGNPAIEVEKSLEMESMLNEILLNIFNRYKLDSLIPSLSFTHTNTHTHTHTHPHMHTCMYFYVYLPFCFGILVNVIFLKAVP